MDLQLKNKKAFVSGSTSGIGMAIAKKLLEEQAEVIISGSSQQSVDKAVARLKAEVPTAKLSGIPTDFTRAASVEDLIAKLNDIDILVNNVGIYEPIEFTKITDSDWDRFFEVNLMSGIRLSRALFPKMLEKNWGRILFITSESASNIPQEMIHYGVSKTALHGLSRGLAKLTKDTQVTVNTIMPGPTATEGVKAHFEKMAQEEGKTYQEVEDNFFKNLRPSSLLQRFAKPEEVANMVCYMASPLSSATNGASLRVEGGIVDSIL